MKNFIRRQSVLLIVCLLFTGGFSAEDAFAKKRSRSFSSRKKTSWSSKKSSSKGSSFSSSKKKKTKSTKKTYTSRSTTRKKKGSLFHSGSQTTSRGTRIADAAKRADSKSKFLSSSKGRQVNKTYRQVVKENPSLASVLTSEKSQTRNARRNTYYTLHTPVNTYYRYSPYTSYRDPYDNLFFRYVTVSWLFHHWDSIDRRRFDDQRLRELELQIAEMKEQGIKQDPNYFLLSADPDLQYTDEELATLQDANEVIELEGDAGEGGIGWLTFFLIGLVVVGGVYFVGIRRY